MQSEDNRFIEEHRGLVTSIAQKLKRQFDLTSDFEDLLQFGYRGLIEARSRFDPSRGVKFSTFAYYRVRGAMLDGVRKMSFLPRRVHEELKNAAASDDIVETTHDNYAARGDQGQEAAVIALDDAVGRLTASFVVSAMGQSEADAPESPEESLLATESVLRLRRVLKLLPERELALIQGHYLQGRRFDEVADELGISKSWASRLHAKALDRLREALTEAEIDEEDAVRQTLQSQQ